MNKKNQRFFHAFPFFFPFFFGSWKGNRGLIGPLKILFLKDRVCDADESRGIQAAKASIQIQYVYLPAIYNVHVGLFIHSCRLYAHS